MKEKRQLSLFDIKPLSREEESPAPPELMDLPISRRHLLGADEMREIRRQSDRFPFENDLMCGFRIRSYAFEYVARLYELLAFRWILEQIIDKNASETDLGLTGLMPWVFESFCSRLPIFIWDCWSDGTPFSHDKGLDGLVYHQRHERPLVGIQAKYLSGVLSPGYIREFYGALTTYKTPLKWGLFFTTSNRISGVHIKTPHAKVFIFNSESIQALVTLTGVISDWLPVYGDFIVSGFEENDEDWQDITARLYVLRERMAKVLCLPQDWPLQLRKEKGLKEHTISKWRSSDLDDLV